MQKRQIYIGLGVLALAAAFVLPVFTQPVSADPVGGAGGG